MTIYTFDSPLDRVPYYAFPYEISHLVCACEQPKYYSGTEMAQQARQPGFEHTSREDRMFLCKLCDKVARFRMLKCTDCNDYFFNFFEHPAKEKGGSVCYSCLDERSPDLEGHRWAGPAWFIPREPIDVKAVMAEEIDLDFDF